MEKIIIIGSRGSDLALWQANYLQAELAKLNLKSEIRIIKTQGDKIQHLSLEKLEGKGFFTKEIEDALLDGSIDLAVHSHKDLPTENTPGLIIGGVSYREDPSELILIRKECVDELKEFHLKENVTVGTSSSRRNVQLKFFRPDIICEDIRGNVPTRIDKLRNGDYNAIVLAFAGVNRLNLNTGDLHVVKIPPTKIIPAPAQGVLAFQCRKDDDKIVDILKKINNKEVATIIAVERKIMNLFNGGCHMPLGAYCKKDKDGFEVWAAQADMKDGSLRRIYKKHNNSDSLAEKIFYQLNTSRDKNVFISTPPSDSEGYIKILKNSGFKTEACSFVKIERIHIEHLPASNWLFFTSKNGAIHFFSQISKLAPGINIAAIGNETANTILSFGHKVDFIGEGGNLSIAKSFHFLAAGQKILFPGALNRSAEIINLLERKCKVITLDVYKNAPFHAKKINADILVFTSPLNVEGFLLGNKIDDWQTIIAIGSTTAAHLNKAGFKKVLIPPHRSLLSVAEYICGIQNEDAIVEGAN
ncbi:MAG: hydroxymethylbilane synthase [Chitinophagales bacterium]